MCVSEGSQNVCVNVERLRKALEASSKYSSFNQLAKAAGVTHATLSYITTGKTDKLKPTIELVKKLADCLEVPVEWLSGEWNRLPFVPFPGSIDFGGEGFKWKTMPKLANLRITYTDSEGRRVTSAPSTIKDPPPTYLTPAQIRLNQFLEKCYSALMRDLEEHYGDDAKSEFQEWGVTLLQLLADIADLDNWRRKCSPGYVIVREAIEQMQEPVRGWIPSWETILAPWLDGKSKIEVPTILSIARLLESDRHGVKRAQLDALEEKAFVFAEVAELRKKKGSKERRKRR